MITFLSLTINHLTHEMVIQKRTIREAKTLLLFFFSF